MVDDFCEICHCCVHLMKLNFTEGWRNKDKANSITNIWFQFIIRLFRFGRSFPVCILRSRTTKKKKTNFGVYCFHCDWKPIKFVSSTQTLTIRFATRFYIFILFTLNAQNIPTENALVHTTAQYNESNQNKTPQIDWKFANCASSSSSSGLYYLKYLFSHANYDCQFIIDSFCAFFLISIIA